MWAGEISKQGDCLGNDNAGSIQWSQAKHSLRQGRGGLLRSFKMLVCSVGHQEGNGVRNSTDLLPEDCLPMSISAKQCSAETLKEMLTYGDADMATGGNTCCMQNSSFNWNKSKTTKNPTRNAWGKDSKAQELKRKHESTTCNTKVKILK